MSNLEKSAPVIIAVCGKGGVGKTSISAAIAKILSAQPGRKVLAIDADPAVGLATALGFTGEKTVDDIRNRLISRVEAGKGGDKQDILSRLDYEVFDALEEQGSLAFLAIGRPEKDGCYCQVNEFLKDIITSLSDNFDYVIIDGEAGIEQINRRVMERVTHLIFVSDPSAKGLNVVRALKEVCDGTVQYQKAGLITNKVRDEAEKNRLCLPEGIPFLGWLPEDDQIRNFDIAGRNLLELPPCPALSALEDCLTRLEL